MRQVGRTRPGLCGNVLLTQQELVEIAHQGLNLVGISSREPRDAPFMDGGEIGAQAVEGSEPASHESPGGQEEPEREHAEREGEQTLEGTLGSCYRARVRSDGDLDRDRPLRTIDLHPLFGNEQGLSLGALSDEHMLGGMIGLRHGEAQRSVPKRARAQPHSAAIRDLPIEPAMHERESWIARRIRNDQRSVRRHLHLRKEKVESVTEIGSHELLRLALEQSRDAEPCERQGYDHGERRGSDETQLQRRAGQARSPPRL